MRVFPLVFLVVAACASYGPIVDLPLAWRGVESSPAPSPPVAQAFAASTLAFGLRDVRPDPYAVGGYEDSNAVIRTSDNIASYCSTQLGQLLVHAGARFAGSPSAVLEAELLEFRVIEGNTFNGVVRIRVIIQSGQSGQAGAGKAWNKTYTGTSKRWGRTHNPENFNEALSNSLVEVAQQLLQDPEFAAALQPASADPAAPLPPASDPYPLPGAGLGPGSSGA